MGHCRVLSNFMYTFHMPGYSVTAHKLLGADVAAEPLPLPDTVFVGHVLLETRPSLERLGALRTLRSDFAVRRLTDAVHACHMQLQSRHAPALDWAVLALEDFDTAGAVKYRHVRLKAFLAVELLGADLTAEVWQLANSVHFSQMKVQMKFLSVGFVAVRAFVRSSCDACRSRAQSGLDVHSGAVSSQR